MAEEIIVDGVNVAGCGAYKDKHCIDKTSIIFCDTNLCSNYPYCYYKQLKRLEQENRELKEENERLKKDFSSYEDDIEDWVSDNSILYQYDDRTPDTLEELQACMESTHEQWQKYKQALEEIRDIAKDAYKNDCKYQATGIYAEITNKINEVLG